MVKLEIVGANSSMAGELIRILINHPEADIVNLYSPSLPGRSVASIHHGLIGESPLFFSDKFNLDNIDLVFIIENDPIVTELLNQLENYPDLKIISLDTKISSDSSIGISEINRKELVREARKAYIPHPAVVVSLIPLVPLARFMLLNSDISIEISLPRDLINNTKPNEIENLISQQLLNNQPSFNKKVNLTLQPSQNSEREIEAKILMTSSLPLEEVENIYEQTYDDHNFTFLTSNDISGKDVEGTHKNLIQISKPDLDTLQIKTVADARLRGGAGDAVHVMNLFFGLHEKTGLSLKPSRY